MIGYQAVAAHILQRAWVPFTPKAVTESSRRGLWRSPLGHSLSKQGFPGDHEPGVQLSKLTGTSR